MQICWDFDTVANCPDQRRRCNAQRCIETWSCPVKAWNFGFFFFHACSLALKLSLKNHQMTTLWAKKEVWVKNHHLNEQSCHLMTFYQWLQSKRTRRAKGKRNHKFCPSVLFFFKYCTNRKENMLLFWCNRKSALFWISSADQIFLSPWGKMGFSLAYLK